MEKCSIDGNGIWFRSYEGEFKKDKFHGQGKMITSKTMTNDMGRNTTLAKLKGLILIGEFKKGRPWNVNLLMTVENTNFNFFRWPNRWNL